MVKKKRFDVYQKKRLDEKISELKTKLNTFRISPSYNSYVRF